MEKKIKVTLNEVNKKRIRIVSYLLVSGLLGWVFAEYVANNVALVGIFAPAINFILFSIEEELNGEGYREALK